MLGSDYGDDYGYAATRIQGTIVKYKGKPVTVTNVIGGEGSDGPVALIRGLKAKEEKAVKLFDLDICPSKMGYVNFDSVASYICRQPLRRDYKQGMRTQQLVSQFGYRIQDIPNHAYYEILVNEYPSFSDCVRTVSTEGGGDSAAWHYDWALDHEDNLLYKFGEVVGKLTGGSLVLDDTHGHLSEQLEEALK